MNARKRSVALGVLCVLAISGLTGCPFLLPSSGGGNLFTAYAKISQGRMTTLTPHEVRVVTDFVIERGQVQDLQPLTIEQAEVVVDFLKRYNINSLGDFADLDPNEIEITDELRKVIEAITGVTLDEHL